ncbi:MAG: hypothetical protein DRJ38_08200 [Thermoprotei archaeon]|nr:MAG: hypothetical protein DRJ38_08200 [Thermoprotei archaeon]
MSEIIEKIVERIHGFEDYKYLYERYFNVKIDRHTRIRFRIDFEHCRVQPSRSYFTQVGGFYVYKGIPFKIVRLTIYSIEIETVRDEPIAAMLDFITLVKEFRELFKPTVIYYQVLKGK